MMLGCFQHFYQIWNVYLHWDDTMHWVAASKIIQLRSCTRCVSWGFCPKHHTWVRPVRGSPLWAYCGKLYQLGEQGCLACVEGYNRFRIPAFVWNVLWMEFFLIASKRAKTVLVFKKGDCLDALPATGQYQWYLSRVRCLRPLRRHSWCTFSSLMDYFLIALLNMF